MYIFANEGRDNTCFSLSKKNIRTYSKLYELKVNIQEE